MKPGDMVMLVNTDFPENNGAIGTLIKFVGTPNDGGNETDLWEVNFPRALLTNNGTYASVGWARQAWLVLINGLPACHETEECKKEPA